MSIMFNKLTYTLIITSIVLLQACSFSSQNRSKTPYFDGVIKFNDEPVESAKVMLSLDSNDSFCHKATTKVSTDENGHFSIKSIKETESYVPFLNYKLDEWVVCAEYNKQRYTLYSNNRYDSGNVTGSIYLDCDLALRPVNKPCLASH